MKLLKTTALAAALVAASVCGAETVYVDWPVDVTPSTSKLTRAEVLADFHLWRLAGMEDQYRSEVPPDTTSLAYRQAEARYAAMRNGPQYAELVKRLQANPLTNVAAAH